MIHPLTKIVMSTDIFIEFFYMISIIFSRSEIDMTNCLKGDASDLMQSKAVELLSATVLFPAPEQRIASEPMNIEK